MTLKWLPLQVIPWVKGKSCKHGHIPDEYKVTFFKIHNAYTAEMGWKAIETVRIQHKRKHQLTDSPLCAWLLLKCRSEQTHEELLPYCAVVPLAFGADVCRFVLCKTVKCIWKQSLTVEYTWYDIYIWHLYVVILRCISITLLCVKRPIAELKGGAHTRFVDAWISNESMKCIWAPPLMEVQQYGALKAAMRSKYTTE